MVHPGHIRNPVPVLLLRPVAQPALVRVREHVVPEPVHQRLLLAGEGLVVRRPVQIDGLISQVTGTNHPLDYGPFVLDAHVAGQVGDGVAHETAHIAGARGEVQLLDPAAAHQRVPYGVPSATYHEHLVVVHCEVHAGLQLGQAGYPFALSGVKSGCKPSK